MAQFYFDRQNQIINRSPPDPPPNNAVGILNTQLVVLGNVFKVQNLSIVKFLDNPSAFSLGDFPFNQVTTVILVAPQPPPLGPSDFSFQFFEVGPILNTPTPQLEPYVFFVPRPCALIGMRAVRGVPGTGGDTIIDVYIGTSSIFYPSNLNKIKFNWTDPQDTIITVFPDNAKLTQNIPVGATIACFFTSIETGPPGTPSDCVVQLEFANR